MEESNGWARYWWHQATVINAIEYGDIIRATTRGIAAYSYYILYVHSYQDVIWISKCLILAGMGG